MDKLHPDTVCFECKGCGKPAFYFPMGHTSRDSKGRVIAEIPPGSVAHSKPIEARRTAAEIDAGKSRISCQMYLRLSAGAYWHLNEDAKRLSLPESYTPLLD